MSESVQKQRPDSARGLAEKGSLTRNDPPGMSSSEIDTPAIMNAIIELQKVDLDKLRKQLTSTVSSSSNYCHSGQHASPRSAWKEEWTTEYMEEKQKLEDKINDLRAQLKNMIHKSSSQEKELLLLQQHVESGNKKVKECMNELDVKEKKLKSQSKELEEARKERDDSLTRLSRLMGQKLSEGNPNITDLSDKNRPSKLGEIYSQLYDNEWTDAFEVLTENFYLDEKSAIELLLKMLLESSKHASDMSQSTMKKIEGLLSGSSEGASPDCKRLLREARKLVDIKKANGFLQDFQEKLTVELKYHREEKLATYMNSCFQLCWLMSIQDPPVVLSSDPVKGDKFDTNLYKCYTHSGDKIDYIVWPALLIYKGGPILAKGVAEPFTIPRVKSAPNVRLEENGISFGRGGQMEYGGKRQASTAKGVAEPFILSTSNGYPSIAKAEATKDVSFDRGSQTKYDGKIRDSASGSDRMPTTYYVKNASFSSESVSKVTPQHPTHESKDRRVHSATPTMSKNSQVSNIFQKLYQQGVLRSSYDIDRFQRFSQDIMHNTESFLRMLYEFDYDRYYRIFVHMYGHFKYT